MGELGKNSHIFRLHGIKFGPILGLCLLFFNFLTRAQGQNLAPSTTPDTTIRLSKDKLEQEVSYNAYDSIVYDADTKKLILYQKANITYDDIKVNADYVEYQQDSSTLMAMERIKRPRDSVDKPRLTQGTESSTFEKLQYNFKSKRALVENAYSQYGDGFILSQQVKRNNDETINGFRSIYTTCNAEVPHFGIAARKIKIIPNKVAVSGSANLVIEEIPTPLILPFGMFPLKKGQKSGFKLPTYDVSQNLGFGIREGGYYFAINDHWDFLALADIYALGTWRAGFKSTYAYRYRFNGQLAFNYAYNKIGEPSEPGYSANRNFMLNWSHSISPNVMPGASFSASVNIGSSKYQVRNTYDPNLYLNNNYTSNISYSKSWTGKPFNFSVAARHNQNTQTGEIQITLPQMNFTVNQVFPFQFRKDIIKPRWYERITASYNVEAINNVRFYDSTFSNGGLAPGNFQNGMKHSVPLSANYQVAKYINTAFSASYTELWYTERSLKQYNFVDGKLDTARERGFYTARYFDAGVNASTRIYGMKTFKKGSIKAIRHVLTPAVNMNFRPDFAAPRFGYYYNTFTDANYNTQLVSYFDGTYYGAPPRGKIGGIGFSLGNNLQMKVRSKKDSTGTKKINLIDGLTLSSFYNLAADSFQWSNLNISYRTTLFESINLAGSASFDPYRIDSVTGRRLPETNWSMNKKLYRFDNFNIALNGSLPLKKKTRALNPEQQSAVGSQLSAYADFNIPWSLNVNYNVNVRKSYIPARSKDTFLVNQDLNFFGDVNLTPNWKIGLRSGYDFRTKQISFTSFDIYRDLHCWEMRLNLIPFGERKSYNFALNVKASVLQDLKLNRRKDFRDFL